MPYSCANNVNILLASALTVCTVAVRPVVASDYDAPSIACSHAGSSTSLSVQWAAVGNTDLYYVSTALLPPWMPTATPRIAVAVI